MAKGKTEKSIRWYAPKKPDFKKLKVGETFEGVFTGIQPSRYGPAYFFKDAENKSIAIGGNRAHLDRAFQEITSSGDFGPDGPAGHRLMVERQKSETTGSGRTVHIFRIGHCLGDCPKGCQGDE